MNTAEKGCQRDPPWRKWKLQKRGKCKTDTIMKKDVQVNLSKVHLVKNNFVLEKKREKNIWKKERLGTEVLRTSTNLTELTMRIRKFIEKEKVSEKIYNEAKKFCVSTGLTIHFAYFRVNVR